MIFRFAVIALIVTAQFVVPSVLLAREAVMTRQEIRDTPLLQRPSRPGHFYGNTVRRSHVRKHQS